MISYDTQHPPFYLQTQPANFGHTAPSRGSYPSHQAPAFFKAIYSDSELKSRLTGQFATKKRVLFRREDMSVVDPSHGRFRATEIAKFAQSSSQFHRLMDNLAVKPPPTHPPPHPPLKLGRVLSALHVMDCVPVAA